MHLLTVLSLTAIMLLLAGISIYEHKKEEKRGRSIIRHRYGAIPTESKGSHHGHTIYWETLKETIPQHQAVDEITWNDLDLDKVFRVINNTYSFLGEQTLYAKLHHLQEDKHKLQDLEKEITWYETHPKERENLQYLFWQAGKEEVNYYLPLFLQNISLHRIPHIWIYRSLQLSLLLLLLLSVFTPYTIFFYLTAGNLLVNAAVYAAMKSKYDVFLDSLGGIIRTVKLSGTITEGEDYPREFIPGSIPGILRNLRSISHMSAVLQKKKQASISGNATDLLRDYLIGATLWDFIQYDKVIRALEGRQEDFMNLFCFAGRIDAAMAISSYRSGLNQYCTPEFVKEVKLYVQDICHPLVTDPVKNTLEMEGGILLTGSNASGKSTFIKAVAINTILAQTIHTCLASSFRMPDAQIITSMAVRDDIDEGESYYIREIRYLKRIIDASRGRHPVICAIDEILRGTNARERIAASVAVAEYLAESNCLVLIATHDLEITTWLATKFHMYYFSEILEGQDVAFDYKLKKGVSSCHNAVRLLESTCFPNDILTRARQIISARDSS